MPEPEQHRHDAVVVGGGVIGLACAWRAARRGLDVCVLERGASGAGATDVAAGMLAPVGEASWGEEALLRANLASMEMWPAFVAELEAESGLEVGLRAYGALHVALDRDESEELRRRHRWQLELGLSAEWLRPAECRRLEPGLSTGIAGGVHVPYESAVDPRRVAAALRSALEAAGGTIESGCEVTGARIEGGRLRGVVSADGRSFLADSVVLAAGAWSGAVDWLPEAARPLVRPVKGEVLTLTGSASEPVCERIVASERVYLVPRADGRLIVGATVEEKGFDTVVTAGGVHELLREAYRALPEVAELELTDARAGLRPGSPDNAPLIGPGAIDGLVVASGHYRNGILLTPLTGEAVGALLAGVRPPVDLAPLDPTRFAGDSPVGTPVGEGARA